MNGSLLLTSTGFANPRIGKKFLTLFEKKPAHLCVLFVPTASRTPEELEYVQESRKELLSLGILKKNIIDMDLNHKISAHDFALANCVYVCGGNTFYLLSKVRSSGFGRTASQFVHKGGIYVGVSAGSIIVCPDIGIAAPFDENDIHLADWSGLKLIDVVVSPHYKKEEKTIIDNYQKKTGYTIVTLTDEEALLVKDGKRVIIK